MFMVCTVPYNLWLSYGIAQSKTIIVIITDCFYQRGARHIYSVTKL